MLCLMLLICLASSAIANSQIKDYNAMIQSTVSALEYHYARMDCLHKVETVGEDTYINWYKVEDSQQVDLDSGRLYVDQNGNLHFSYVKKTDETLDFGYLCGITSVSEKTTHFGSLNYLHVRKITHQAAVKPQLQYTNNGVEALLNSRVTLECVFSGYDPKGPNFPAIKWRMPGGEVIVSNSKYALSSDGRALTIMSVSESDEKNYYCSASNSAGVVGPQAVFLNVTSVGPRDQTLTEGEDVVFSVDSRSVTNERSPSSLTSST